mmetsp:Transcript_24803/g.36707  ORF Transcript_24803/g.36707 Transcript_24803/m.36707 type:complete len:216 (+) Transcript_24803:27-674(+)
MKLTFITIFSLLPAFAMANCKPMSNVLPSYRMHELTSCDSTTNCVCREFTSSLSDGTHHGWLQCDLSNSLSIYPRICTLEEISRETDCMPIEDFKELGVADNCEDMCPGKCRVFPPLFATCDLGDDFVGDRGFPLKCTELVPTRTGNKDEKPCVSMAGYPGAINHMNSRCWNTRDYCKDGKCRVLGTSTGASYFDCDEGNHYVGVFPPLCEAINV